MLFMGKSIKIKKDSQIANYLLLYFLARAKK